MARNALCATTAFDCSKYLSVHDRPTILMSLNQIQGLLEQTEYEILEEEEIELALEDLDFEYIDLDKEGQLS